MAYYYNDYGDLVIIQDDDQYRNSRRDHRRGQSRPRPRPRPYHYRPERPRPRSQPETVVVRPSNPPPPQAPQAPVIVEQPIVQERPDYGLELGGVRLGFGRVTGVLLTLVGVGLQVGSHFVPVPELPATESAAELAAYQDEKNKAERKIRVLETAGRGLSDAGQLAAFNVKG